MGGWVDGYRCALSTCQVHSSVKKVKRSVQLGFFKTFWCSDQAAELSRENWSKIHAIINHVLFHLIYLSWSHVLKCVAVNNHDLILKLWQFNLRHLVIPPQHHWSQVGILLLWHICDSVANYLEHGVIHEENLRCLGLCHYCITKYPSLLEILQYQAASLDTTRKTSCDALTV